MKALVKILGILSIIFFIYSCDMINKKESPLSSEYDLEYSIETNIKNITKIVYTDLSGNINSVDKVDGNWRMKVKGLSGATIKLEVFGEHNDKGDSDIYLQLSAKNGEDIVERSVVKTRKNNKLFHYYIIHVLE